MSEITDIKNQVDSVCNSKLSKVDIKIKQLVLLDCVQHTNFQFWKDAVPV